jgi:PAS domain S-box-containing protein
LTQDAVALVAEVLRTDLSGASETLTGEQKLSLRVVSSELDPEAIASVIHETPLRSEDSLAGYALAMATPVASRDLATETRFHDRFLRTLGVRGALSVPLHQDKEPFGTLEVYCRQPREFSVDDWQFAESISHLLTSSIGRAKTEAALHQQRALAEALLDGDQALLIVLDLEGRIANINAACRQVTGFALAQIEGRAFASAFVPPEDMDLFPRMFRQAIEARTPCKFESGLLDKDGVRFRVGWSLRVTWDAYGAPLAMLLSGINRGEQAPQAFQVRPCKGGVENRTSPRRVFQYRQRIAPLLGNAMPSEADFFEVDCADISAGGLSFYLDRAPEFDKLIVALGKPPVLTHFAAQVVRTAETVVDGQRQYVVGCRFLGRFNSAG